MITRQRARTAGRIPQKIEKPNFPRGLYWESIEEVRGILLAKVMEKPWNLEKLTQIMEKSWSLQKLARVMEKLWNLEKLAQVMDFGEIS